MKLESLRLSGLLPDRLASKHETHRWNATTAAAAGITFVGGRHRQVGVTRRCSGGAQRACERSDRNK
jgi:hypothetical protein